MNAILLFLQPALVFAVGTAAINPGVEYREYDSHDIKQISITNGAGRVAILPMSVNKIEITTNKRKFAEHCSLRVTKIQALKIEIQVDNPLNETCEVDMDVRVPKDVDLEVKTGSSNVSIDGLAGGRLTFDLGSGNMIAKGSFKQIEGRTGSGNVDLSGLTSETKVKVGSGEVRLGFMENAKGDIAVSSGSGDATLLFPKGSKIKTALSTGSGSSVNEMVDSSRPDVNISVRSGSGDVAIKAY